jgi:hypothetical protein
MDLVLGHHREATCLMSLNYDEIVSQDIILHRRGGERVSIIVVLFNHGSKLDSIKESLADIPVNRTGWYLGSPGEILDRVQDIVCPGSVVNTRRRALDQAIPLLTQPDCAPRPASRRTRKKPAIT